MSTAADIAYLAGFEEGTKTVRYLTVRLYVAYVTLLIVSTITLALLLKGAIRHG